MGVFQEAIQTASVIAVFKKGSTQDVNNTVQYLYYSSLTRLLKSSCTVDNILYDLQYGFRKNKSTSYPFFNN